MPDLFLVFRISRKIPSEKALLVIEPPYQEWHHGREREEVPKRTQGKRSANQVQQRAGVQRVAHNGIWPSRNHLLTVRDFDGRRSERVFFVDEENEIEPYRNENVPDYNAGERHCRPPEAVVERRDDREEQ